MTAPASSSLVLTERRGRVGVLTINRPDKRNALSTDVRTAFAGALAELARDTGVRAVVVTGAGEKAFVAGADIAEFEGRTAVDQYFIQRGPSMLEQIERLPKPVIAAINGFCLGGGMELALACDVRIASTTARFGQPEINLGIIPGGGGTQRLPRVIGLGGALRLVLSGEIIDADEALRLHLVEMVVPPDELMTRAMAVAETMASKSPVAIAAAKEATRAAVSTSLDEGLKLERSLFQLCFASEDKKEGVRAFLEKRPAEFTGR